MPPKTNNKKKRNLKKKNRPLTSRILRHRTLRVPKRVKKSNRGVIYLSHVPHGFYEEEMRNFFGQFGKVTAVKIPRSSRTGKYKGYAFVEFFFEEVAKIAAETMNNYLMFNKILKVKYLSPEEQKPYMFKFPKSKLPLTIRRKKYLRDRSNRVLTEEQSKKENEKLQKIVSRKSKKLKKLGIDYDFQIDQNTEATTT